MKKTPKYKRPTILEKVKEKYFNQGVSEETIASELKVNRFTIRKAIDYIKQSSGEEIKVTNDELYLKHKITTNFLRKQAWILFEKTKNEGLRLKLLRLIADLTKEDTETTIKLGMNTKEPPQKNNLEVTIHHFCHKCKKPHNGKEDS
jgi:DNA-binding transcriptional regulator LsrR (DeoR family)